VFGGFLLAVAGEDAHPAWDPSARCSSPSPRPGKGSQFAKGHKKLIESFAWLGHPAVAAVVAIIGVDIIFALDSIPASLAISKSAPVIIAATSSP